MKIMVLCLNRAGSTLKCASKLADSLADMVELKMIVSGDSPPGLLPRKVPLVKIKTGSTVWGNFFCTLNPLGYLRIIHEVASFKPDLIHFPVEHAWHIILHPCLKKYPIVQTIHDPIRHSGEENIFYDIVRYMELIYADRIIVMSTKFQKTFTNFGVEAERVDAICHGSFVFDNKIWPDGPFPPPPLKKKILFAGRIRRYKGIDVLLKAFAVVLQNHADATLIIAGEGNITDYKKLLDTTKNVTVINHRISERELAELHAECDFVVAPFIDASQSGVVSLAQSNGRAVVTTRTGGVPEQINDGETGALVEPNNVQQLADAISFLLSHEKKNLKMAAMAKLLYKNQFNWKTIAEKTFRTYMSTCKENKRTSESDSAPCFFQSIRCAISNYRKGKAISKNRSC